MKSLFYFFGIVRGKRVFVLDDAIRVDGCPSDLDEGSLEKLFKDNGLNLGDFVQDQQTLP